jgi:hypothetical protein
VTLKLLNRKLTTVYQCFQKTHTVPDAKERRRAERASVEGGLKEVLDDDDDPRKLEIPVVEYARSALLMAWDLITLSVIAVHGLGPKYPATWTKDDTMWLKDFLPEDFPHARILAFVDPSKAFENPDFVDLRALGGRLLRSLVRDREGFAAKAGGVHFVLNR